MATQTSDIEGAMDSFIVNVIKADSLVDRDGFNSAMMLTTLVSTADTPKRK
jgi:hypothetical protein